MIKFKITIEDLGKHLARTEIEVDAETYSATESQMAQIIADALRLAISATSGKKISGIEFE